MKILNLTFVVFLAPAACWADNQNAVISNIIDNHVLPRFDILATSTQRLSDAAKADCSATSDDLLTAYGSAFDAWVSASHLRFGPTEKDDRAFALAFWPDSRGATPRALSTLLADQDPIAASADDYRQVSIAARGFYALEFLLYDDALMAAGEPDYHCQLVQTISADIAATAQTILDDWRTTYSATIQNPSPDGVYRTDQEALQEMFKSLSTGLQFTSETRLGRPLGTFDRPRPTRAEVRRSGRSARHVTLSLQSLQELAVLLGQGNDTLVAHLKASFEIPLSQLSALDDPTFSSVAQPQARLKIEVIQQSVEAVRGVVRSDLGPTLGVAAGFNSLDGD